MTRMGIILIRWFIDIYFHLFSYNCTVVCLFWAQQKRLNKVTITMLSRFLYFPQANYRQNSNIPRNIHRPIRIYGIREYAYSSS